MWHIFVIPLPRRLRQEDGCRFKASLAWSTQQANQDFICDLVSKKKKQQSEKEGAGVGLGILLSQPCLNRDGRHDSRVQAQENEK